MKLIDFNNFSLFIEMREKMNIPKNFKADFNGSEAIRKVLKLQEIKTKGLDIPIDELVITSNRTLEHPDFPGQKSVVYIRDYNGGRMYNRDDNLPKFHVSWCKTLQEMTEKRKYDRYVVSHRNDGVFILNKMVGGSVLVRNEELELKVCKNCLATLNYLGYDASSKEEKNEIYESFTLKKFFELYNVDIHIQPLHNEHSQPLNEYAKEWKKISFEYRKLKRFICQDCGKDCSKDTAELHVHHIDGNKYNNSPSNLEAVCVSCHSKKPMHDHLLLNPSFKKYLKK